MTGAAFGIVLVGALVLVFGAAFLLRDYIGDGESRRCARAVLVPVSTGKTVTLQFICAEWEKE